MVTLMPEEWQASRRTAQKAITERTAFDRRLRTSRIRHLRGMFAFEDASAEHNPITVVVQLKREDEHVPNVPWTLLRERQTAECSVNISFARVGDRTDDFLPIFAQFRKFF